jgi:hypothetical protein
MIVLYILIFVFTDRRRQEGYTTVYFDVGGVISFAIENRVASAASGTKKCIC